MNTKLANKVALVTGGGSGIGRVIAQRLANEGATVMIIGRTEGTLKESASQHNNIFYMIADVGNSESLADVLSEIKNRFGKLDILVNNAGVAPVTPLSEVELSEFDNVFRINVRGVVDLTKQALPLLKESKGNVINISSANANRPLPNMSIYSSSKAAVRALTQVWARELAKDSIRVNSVAVGPIMTPIYDKTDLSEEAAKEHMEKVKAIVPLGRFGTSEEVASVVAFLASDEGGYVTGSDYAVDGGVGA